MKLTKSYKIDLLQVEHGIWLFVTDAYSNQIIMEQAGIKDLDQAFQFAKGIILGNEKHQR